MALKGGYAWEHPQKPPPVPGTGCFLLPAAFVSTARKLIMIWEVCPLIFSYGRSLLSLHITYYILEILQPPPHSFSPCHLCTPHWQDASEAPVCAKESWPLKMMPVERDLVLGWGSAPHEAPLGTAVRAQTRWWDHSVSAVLGGKTRLAQASEHCNPLSHPRGSPSPKPASRQCAAAASHC